MADNVTTYTHKDFLAQLAHLGDGSVADTVRSALDTAAERPEEAAEIIAETLQREVSYDASLPGFRWTRQGHGEIRLVIPTDDEAPAADDAQADLAQADEATQDEAAHDEPAQDEPDEAAEPDEPDEQVQGEADDPAEPNEPAQDEPEPEPAEDEPVPASPAPSFFRDLAQLAADATLVVTVARVGDDDNDPTLQVAIIPSATGETGKATAQPFSVTANASELDDGFASLITTAVDGNTGIQAAIDELEAAKKAEAEAKKEEAKAKKKAAANKNKSTDKKKETDDKAASAKADAGPTLFDTADEKAAVKDAAKAAERTA